MYYTDDPVADFGRWDHEQSEQLKKRPVCSNCGQPIQDDHYYLINDENICPDCLENEFRKDVEDYGE